MRRFISRDQNVSGLDGEPYVAIDLPLPPSGVEPEPDAPNSMSRKRCTRGCMRTRARESLFWMRRTRRRAGGRCFSSDRKGRRIPWWSSSRVSATTRRSLLRYARSGQPGCIGCTEFNGGSIRMRRRIDQRIRGILEVDVAWIGEHLPLVGCPPCCDIR